VQKVWQGRRQKQLDEYLDALTSEIKRDVISACLRDIQDLGLVCADHIEEEGNEEKVARLVEMGFDASTARHALEAHNGVVESAAHSLAS
jgi:hypothetical protein